MKEITLGRGKKHTDRQESRWWQ